jgi:hypothetical protein
MKIVIRMPALWSSKTEIISWFIVSCLRRRGVATKLKDFNFVDESGLTMMYVSSAESSPEEQRAAEDCILGLNDVLTHSTLAERTLLDELRKFSYDDQKELEKYEALFKKWFAELDAARQRNSDADAIG